MSQIIRRRGRRIDAGFAALPNSTVRNNDLTLRARALLLLFMSHEPDVWSMTVASVAKETKEGRDVIAGVFRELEAAGYIRRTRENDARGLIVHYCDVYPYGDAESAIEDVPDEEDDPPSTGYQSTENQSTENQSLVDQSPFRRTSLEDNPPSPSLVVEEPPTYVTTSPEYIEPPPQQTIPNSESLEQPAGLPLVRRRQLIKAGVTEAQGPLWEQAWTTVTSMQWPDGLEMEARQYPDDHLAQHIHQTLERGYVLSPSRWVQFFISDRQDQIKHALARLEQEARLGEDPAEREARQNRHLPPDRSHEFDPPTTTAGVQG